MSGDRDLLALAEEAGLAPRWEDAFGKVHEVTPDALRATLAALGLPAGDAGDLAASRERLRASSALPPLITATQGAPTPIAVSGRWVLTQEDGSRSEGILDGGMLPAVDVPGYHRLVLGDAEITLAVAPPRCFSLKEAAPGRKLWGLTAQLYALRREGDGGIGDFASLAGFARAAAAHGASAVAISPVHAQFSADPDRFSPYAPSSRIALNVLHADAKAYDTAPPSEEEARLSAADLLDWAPASRARLARLREALGRALDDPEFARDLTRFRRDMGEVVERHARFEALHAHHFDADPTRWHWRSWDRGYQDPASPAVAAFAREHAYEVTLHAAMQYLADRGLRGAQDAARAAGMPVGLIADLAVGTDAGGSHAWSRQAETLIGLTIGAPPDLLSREGQNWGITAFSPRGLLENGFGGFIELLRGSMRHAGGVRIDHAMGLARLWVIPDGAESKDGVYLHFPVADMLRLVALESLRHRAVVLGEDLGTLPAGFQERLDGGGITGMRVLWFERDKAENFTPPPSWSPGAAAMTSTHDLATVAGWWRGRDLAWRSELGLLRDPERETVERGADRSRLWQAFRASGATAREQPAEWDSDPVADAAAVHIGLAACEISLLPIEDALGLPEQPNLPGTLHEHPNWQRRLPGPATGLLHQPGVAARLAAMEAARRR